MESLLLLLIFRKHCYSLLLLLRKCYWSSDLGCIVYSFTNLKTVDLTLVSCVSLP